MIWLVTSPLVLHRFYVVSLSGLVLNGVLWLPVLFAMIAGFAVLAMGWLLPPLGALFGVLCDYSLAMVEWSIDAAARVPGSYFWAAGPSEGWLYVYYGLLAAPFVAPRIVSGRRSLLLAGMWVGVGLAYCGGEPVEAGGARAGVRFCLGRAWIGGCGRVARRTSVALRRRPAGIAACRRKVDRSLSAVAANLANRRARPVARRHRPLQRSAGAARKVLDQDDSRLAANVSRGYAALACASQSD